MLFGKAVDSAAALFDSEMQPWAQWIIMHYDEIKVLLGQYSQIEILDLYV